MFRPPISKLSTQAYIQTIYVRNDKYNGRGAGPAAGHLLDSQRLLGDLQRAGQPGPAAPGLDRLHRGAQHPGRDRRAGRTGHLAGDAGPGARHLADHLRGDGDRGGVPRPVGGRPGPARGGQPGVMTPPAAPRRR